MKALHRTLALSVLATAALAVCGVSHAQSGVRSNASEQAPSGISGASGVSGPAGSTGAAGSGYGTSGTSSSGLTGTGATGNTASDLNNVNSPSGGAVVQDPALNSTTPSSSSNLDTNMSAPSQSSDTSSSNPSGYSSGTSGTSGSSVDTANTPMAFEAPGAGPDSSYSWLPYTTRGYVGVSGGQGDYSDVNGIASADDDTTNKAFKVYTGGQFNEYFGIELAYINPGKLELAGRDLKAQGANLSLTAQAPLGQWFSVFAKIGGTYGWTKVEGPGVDDDESGGGFSYGAGVRVNFNPNWAAVLEYETHQFHFPGDDKNDITMTTIGIQYRF